MGDAELDRRIAEAKEKMFGTRPPTGGVVLLVKGNAQVQSPNAKVEVSH